MARRITIKNSIFPRSWGIGGFVLLQSNRCAPSLSTKESRERENQERLSQEDGDGLEFG